MKHFLIAFDEKASELVPETVLRALKGVTDVELVSGDEFDFSKISLPGPPLTGRAVEKLAAEIESDVDFLSENEAPAYLAQLKSEWSKSSE